MNKPLAMLLLLLGAALLALAPEATAVKRQKVAPSYAWTISEPLGLHYAGTIDTLQYNYYQTGLPTLGHVAYSLTGNYGSEGQNQVFFERAPHSDFFFEDALSEWLPSVKTQVYYNTRIPMTLLSYQMGGNRYSNQDRLKGIFSGNVNKQIQVGAALDYIYSKGSYDQQSNKNFAYRIFGSYIGHRYELQTFFNAYNFLNKESGGITDDRYITDPAEVQGGVTKVDTKTIPTRLNNAHSQVWGTEFYMNHRYKVGYYRRWNDTLPDTIIAQKEYVPVTSFIWTLNYKSNKHKFINKDAAGESDFFEASYLTPGFTNDTTRYWRLTNTFGIDLLEGSRSWAKFGLSAYATYEMRHYAQTADTLNRAVATLPDGLTAIPDELRVKDKDTDNAMWVGGQLTKRHGSVLTYDVDARFGLLGSVSGDFSVSGNVHTKIPLGRDSMRITGYGYLKNEAVPYFLRRFRSNHLLWNNDFGKTRRFRAGGELYLPHTGTRLNVGYETMQNYVFINEQSRPEQSGSAVHVLSATLDQRLNFRALHWDNQVVYQTSSNQRALALPKLAVYSNLYLYFRIAGVLGVQFGVDGNYYTRYYAPAYAPSIMAFRSQSDDKLGNYAILNAYANFKLKKARFFVVMSHFNQGLFGGDNCFATPHYPLNPRRLQMGVSVDFTN